MKDWFRKKISLERNLIEEELHDEIKRCKKLLAKYIRESSPRFTTIRTAIERTEEAIEAKDLSRMIRLKVRLSEFR